MQYIDVAGKEDNELQVADGEEEEEKEAALQCSRTLSYAAYESEIHPPAPQGVIFLKELSNNPDYLVTGSVGLLFYFHNFPLCLLHAYLNGQRYPLAGRVRFDRSTRKELRKHHYFPWRRVLPARGSDNYGAGYRPQSLAMDLCDFNIATGSINERGAEFLFRCQSSCQSCSALECQWCGARRREVRERTD